MKKLAIVLSLATLLTACGEDRPLAPVTMTPTPMVSMSPTAMMTASPSAMTTPTTKPSASNTVTPKPTQQYTMADIAKHASKTDCWFAIHDKVYNVTQFIASGMHAGGDTIVEGCGKDATKLFEKRPGDNEPHSDQAKSYLPNFEIGSLKK